jgi:hypothetical protein
MNLGLRFLYEVKWTISFSFRPGKFRDSTLIRGVKKGPIPHPLQVIIRILSCKLMIWPIPVAARSKAWVCGRALARIIGLNATGGMDVCLL